MGDAGLGAEKEASEVTNTLLGGNKDGVAEKCFLELVQLRRVDNDVRRDAAATGNLAAAIGLTNLGWMIGYFALIVIFIQRHSLVVTLNQATGRRVVTSGGERQSGAL